MPGLMFENKQPVIAFSGGGFLFWWQAGVFESLRRSNKISMSTAVFYGSSCGSIMAALACSGFDLNFAKQTALRIAADNNLWDSRLRMISNIGNHVSEFMRELLPENAAKLCRNRLNIYATRVIMFPCPRLSHVCLNSFDSNEDIISACLASIHVPFLVDGRATYSLGGARYIDGTVLSADYPANAIVINPVHDRSVKGTMFQNYTQDAFSDLILKGRKYGDQMMIY